jgi:hypothetical protein
MKKDRDPTAIMTRRGAPMKPNESGLAASLTSIPKACWTAAMRITTTRPT